MNLGSMLRTIVIVFVIIIVVIFAWKLATPTDAADSESGQRDYLVTLISWVPMLILIGIWLYFMSRMRSGQSETVQHLERSKQHMDAVEHKLDRIVALLERRDRQ